MAQSAKGIVSRIFDDLMDIVNVKHSGQSDAGMRVPGLTQPGKLPRSRAGGFYTRRNANHLIDTRTTHRDSTRIRLGSAKCLSL